MKWKASCGARGGLKRDEEDDFSISTPDQIIQQFDKITGLIGLGGDCDFGAGSAGGRHRRHEHHAGERDGADARDRRPQGARARGGLISSAQFLAEAMALTGAGGVLGIIVAVLITMLVGALVPALPSSVPAWAVITAFTVSVAIGLFFGVWPAVKAARLDPVEALRYE